MVEPRTSALTGLAALTLLLSACSGGAAPQAEDQGAAPSAKAPEQTAAKDTDGAKAPAQADAPAKAEGPVEREPLPEETHFTSLRQLTFGGENAEAYLSFAEDRLIFQSTRGDMGCDQIFTMDLEGRGTTMVSTGKGRTTCAYFLPKDERIVYASTHAAADDCLPPPDRSKGYVWKLYDEFDIYVANADGSDPKVLAASPGYDAEATVSPAGDTIVFTSTRDGDPELYVMDIDGQNLRRLTNAPGYDGGAFFSFDGKKIIWRANRPTTADEQAKYTELREEGLVRPTALELMVMNADGSEQRVITNNGAANFGPFWHPDGERVIFSSNLADPMKRNFDLFIIDTAPQPEGQWAEPERVTFTKEFDGFPMFTRDGEQLVFASNRHHDKDGETNVFIAGWKD
ncbi:WD40-like Beta Propeller [Plesiocystis pacifica SIR-1]|uniref:WD40-like Beta Propeller n=1 Tax=Plesiocystis pacifica SIR-1 TaxID=391625 RepID=A6G0V9_9BACT|nr:PD40 domain-containing protein [Plesiocystis pacifica]EDM80497.1 WD40-like Beta Propeller [Plesiocystis pacifica SIR-1]